MQQTRDLPIIALILLCSLQNFGHRSGYSVCIHDLLLLRERCLERELDLSDFTCKKIISFMKRRKFFLSFFCDIYNQYSILRGLGSRMGVWTGSITTPRQNVFFFVFFFSKVIFIFLKSPNFSSHNVFFFVHLKTFFFFYCLIFYILTLTHSCQK